MGTIAQKLTYLDGTKTAIKNAIVDKGVSVSSSDTFRSYASKIASIPSGTGKYKPSYLAGFSSFTGTSLLYETQNLDTSDLTAMNGWFNGCNNLTTIDLTGWDTENTTTFSFMFRNCRSLTSLDLSSFKTTSIGGVGSLTSMFDGCSGLTFLDLRQFVLSNFTSVISSFLNSVSTSCVIVVKDNTEKTWWNTYYPTYTNVRTVAEYTGQ